MIEICHWLVFIAGNLGKDAFWTLIETDWVPVPENFSERRQNFYIFSYPAKNVKIPMMHLV